jgi:hypothetical protein
MPLKMGSITKALATGLVLKKEHTDDKKVKKKAGAELCQAQAQLC